MESSGLFFSVLRNSPPLGHLLRYDDQLFDLVDASPAVRRACPPAEGIEVNEFKCMYMRCDWLFWSTEGVGAKIYHAFSVRT